MNHLSFCATLPASYYADLENLVFFNGQQDRARSAIVESLERYGEPRIVSEDGTLRVIVATRDDVQCLFALWAEVDSLELVGIIVYLRTEIDTILVVHMAVVEDSPTTDEETGTPLVLSLVQEVRKVAQRLHGVRRVTLMHPQGGQFHIPIHRETSTPVESPTEPVDSLRRAP